MFKAIVLEETDGKVAAALQELEDSRLPGFAGAGGPDGVSGCRDALYRRAAVSEPG